MKKYLLTLPLLLLPILILLSSPTQAEAAYTISGSLGTTGATVTITGGGTSPCGVSAGSYACTNIPSGSNVVIRPSKSGGAFSPTTLSFNNVTTNLGEKNFTFIHTLSVSKTGSGTTNPSGTTSYSDGVAVTIFATPAAGYTLASWSGNCSFIPSPPPSNTCTLVMNGDKTATANFTATAPATYTISGSLGTTGATVTITGGGTSPCGVSAGSYACTNIPSGSNVVIRPSKSGGAFSPTTLSFNNVTTNLGEKNFTFAITQNPICGNGVKESGEQCDNGANNQNCPTTKTCSTSCTTNSCAPPPQGVIQIPALSASDIFKLYAGPGIHLTPDVGGRQVTVGLDTRSLINNCGNSTTGKIYWDGSKLVCGTDQGGGGGVSKIIAGSNVTINSTGANGTGDVTINATVAPGTGDNLGDHTATEPLKMSGNSITLGLPLGNSWIGVGGAQQNSPLFINTDNELKIRAGVDTSITDGNGNKKIVFSPTGDIMAWGNIVVADSNNVSRILLHPDPSLNSTILTTKGHIVVADSNNVARVDISPAGEVFATAGVELNHFNSNIPSQPTRPLCDISSLTMLWFDRGGTGGGSALYACGRNGASPNVYSWKQIINW